ncbi:TolC family protein [Methylomonas koyamae]|uniref:TolC family protein n=1 Tax=Methylomonas koyamae TaxID=702114 RepID=UPI000BC2C611|nr:TolC family protein [Methylomonas koyamae]ATG90189.1 membrane protein [Methylomonas koyamae]
MKPLYHAHLPVAVILLIGLLCTLSAGLHSAPACAQTVEPLPERVTMAQLLAITRDRSPRFAALAQRLEAADAEIVAAGVLPNPKLSYGRNDLLTRQNTMYDGHVQQQVLLEMPVMIAGQRGARVEAAAKSELAAAAAIEAEFAELLREEWGLFVKQLADRRRSAVLQETTDYLGHLAEIVSGRNRAGNASRYDLLRVELEHKALQTRLETVANDLAADAGRLGVLLGLPEWKPQAAGKLDYLNVSTDLERLWAEAAKLNPALAAARLNESAADAGVERAERERWPVPTLQLGSAFTDQPYGNASYAGVSVELPIFDRGQGGMARANAEKRAATLARELSGASMRGELENAVDQLGKRRATRIKFENEVVGKLNGLKAMGEASYRLGKSSLLELLDASRSRTETQLTHLDLIQAEIEAELDVLKTAGLLAAAAAER